VLIAVNRCVFNYRPKALCGLSDLANHLAEHLFLDLYTVNSNVILAVTFDLKTTPQVTHDTCHLQVSFSFSTVFRSQFRGSYKTDRQTDRQTDTDRRDTMCNEAS